MPIGRRVWGVGKALFLVGALLATFVVFFLISMRVAIRAGEVQVPDLKGLTVEDATRALQDLQLRPRVEEMRRPDATVPAGRVVQQEPAGGEDARPQRTVKVWLSAGPHTTVVPSLVGQSERTARIRLDQDGIMPVVSEIHSDDYSPDTVVAQDPPPPARTPRVSLLVNRGGPPAAFMMPSVVGMDAERVIETLTDAGMRVTTTVAGAAAPSTVPAATPPNGVLPPAAPPAPAPAPSPSPAVPPPAGTVAAAPPPPAAPPAPAPSPGAPSPALAGGAQAPGPAAGHAVVVRQQPSPGARIVQGGAIALEVNR